MTSLSIAASPVDRRPRLGLVSAQREPQIVLAALARLRWLAVVGQLLATGIAAGLLKLRLPIEPIAIIILLTAFSNLLLALILRWTKPAPGTVQAILLLDVCLLTGLLYLSGGPQNPFSSLYLVHVAMAVIVLGSGWTWVIVSAVACCYGGLFIFRGPLVGTFATGLTRLSPAGLHPASALPEWITGIGNWVALVLVAVLIAVFIGQVIRSLKQRDVELASLRERSAKNQHLAALTTLAAGAAHELSTPLGTIAVAAKELERNIVGNHPGDKAAGAEDVGMLAEAPETAAPPASPLDLQSLVEDALLIRRQVDRCRVILRRMKLDVGEDSAQRKRTALKELENRLRENLDPRDQPRLQTRWDGSVDAVIMPARAIEQALLVLVRNAFDASPPDSPVTLEVRRDDGHVRFMVQDAGCGMPPELLRRVGEPFFTTKEPGKGMGLGLYLVGLVAESCGATFSIDSAPGRGTQCTLDLPEQDPGR